MLEKGSRTRRSRRDLPPEVTKGQYTSVLMSQGWYELMIGDGRTPQMELASDTKQIAKYSPTSTPILDVLRPLPARRRVRLSAGEYFFLSGAVILALIALPEFRRSAESLAARLGVWPAGLVTCLIIPGGALFLGLVAHEAGHLLAAWLTGFRLAPRKWRILVGGKYDAGRKLYSCDALRLGVLSLDARKLDHLPRRLCLLVLGGPLASFILPLLLEAGARAAQAGFLTAFAVHVFSATSVLLGVAELLPDTGRGNSSDGARILMILKNDAGAQRWFSTIQLQLALERGEHPRTWDEPTVTRVTAIDDDTRDAVAARWLGYLWAAERQDITAAAKYLEEALAAPAAASAWIRDRLFLEAAVFQAWFRDDLAPAQFWVAQIRSRKLTPAHQLRLNIALLWAEGKLFDAWEKLGDYLALLRRLPASPARDLAGKSAQEWKTQMESRMLARAWRAMYSVTQEVELSTAQSAASSGVKSPEIASW